jgi:L-amino acid N-acyltransferase YncA
MAVIRLATPADAQGILDIYAPYILHTSLTFETEVPHLDAFRERIRSYLIHWPWLLCEEDGTIMGYAYASRYRERTGYQWCVETSVYIRENFQKRGIGSSLYRTLIEILKQQGYRNVYAVINLPNDASVKFHERLGFRWFASYENVGYKLGTWKTVGWWHLAINGYSDNPPPPVKFSELDKNLVLQIMNRRQPE